MDNISNFACLKYSEDMSKVALITGASSGIGEATARILAAEGYDLIVTGRRVARLNDLKQELGKKFNIRVLPLTFDIRESNDVSKMINNLAPDWKKIDVLINNAGLAAGLNPIHEGSLNDWERMIDTNIKGLLYITRLVSGLMIDQGHGHIINISSIAGKEVYENGNVYSATKHAVEALTKGMRIDLLKYGIKVSSVSPGAVDTEFSMVRFDGDSVKANRVYEGYTPLSAQDIAEAILFIISRPAHVNINDILIMPTAQANATTVSRKI